MGSSDGIIAISVAIVGIFEFFKFLFSDKNDSKPKVETKNTYVTKTIRPSRTYKQPSVQPDTVNLW